MGNENRKRGTRGKKGKKAASGQDHTDSHDSQHSSNNYGPTHEVTYDRTEGAQTPQPDRRQQVDAAAIFGFIDPDVQQYFKGVENALDEAAFETAEDQQLFLENVYTEVQGKELVLATDHSCSLILEKLLRVSNDFQLRVFFDKMNGNFLKIFTHRFASHVCQTLVTLCADAVEREVRSNETKAPAQSIAAEDGVLLSAEELILNMCKQTQDEFTALISDPFASHVLRVIIHVLAGRAVDDGSGKGNIRSKKSAKYNDANNSKVNASVNQRPTRLVPPSFKEMLRSITEAITSGLSATIVRSLAVHQVANPVLQLLLEVQAKDDAAGKDALVDKLLMDITQEDQPGQKNDDRDAYVETLLRDQVGSHLLETIVRVASPALFQKFYTTYFRGRLSKLSFHPIANYVIQQFFVNAKNAIQLEMMIDEVLPSFEEFLKCGRPGVIRAVVEAANNVGACHKQVVKGLCNAFHTSGPLERRDFLNVVLHMETHERFKARDENQEEKRPSFHPQGAVILQLLLQYPEEHHKIVIDSYFAQKDDLVYAWTMDNTGSHVIEAFLTSPTVNLKIKKKILKSFLGKYHVMALDKYGGHTVDKCWAVSDIDMKEKIATELLQHEQALSQSFYGKFILRNCKIDQFKRKKADWLEREKGNERKKDMFKDILGDAILATASGKQRAEALQLDLPAPNPKMADLGFGGGIAGVKTVTEKKKKKSKKSSDDPDKLMIVDDNEEVKEREKYKSDEIDKLFKKRNARDSAASTANDDSAEEEDEEELEEEETTPKKKKKVSKDVAQVLEAIDATKKKKKKSKSEDKDGKKKDKDRKEKESKKRKFMS
ncbi:Nucleolar protein 9 [Actinomortierella ambigua]|uniref:Nucleolar protein 9 n=1 Tax=Actinomortierella ambigua TaxID=1343610 RepID=A0A9P6Q6E4_9FUNG|nr:Nucleolar protein 9 [Actinomortierella ambigua]KAG0259467.1 Nucleolar protein 9 [Actinomortierella ambigua]